MEINKTIPEITKTYEVNNIKFLLKEDKAIVSLMSNIQEKKEVDLSSIIEFTPKEDMLVIKDFLNQIIASSLDIEEIDIPDTLFKIKEVDSSINEK